MILQGARKYPVTEIVVHCSATYPSWMAASDLPAQVAEIRRWHVEDRKWRDIGYHKIIGRDGAVMDGRPLTVVGAGVAGHNNGVVHICLIGGGGSSAEDRFQDYFTKEQGRALADLITDLRGRTALKRLSGHNEWAAKACPGFFVPAWARTRGVA